MLQGILRTLDPEQRVFVREQVGSIARSVAEAMGAEAEYHVTESYGPTINDDRVTAVAEATAQTLVGREGVVLEREPELGTEDFSYFTLARPSCFFHLGCRKPAVSVKDGSGKAAECAAAVDGYAADGDGGRAVLHNSRFTLDEDCLKYGVAMHVGNVLALLEEGLPEGGK